MFCIMAWFVGVFRARETKRRWALGPAQSQKSKLVSGLKSAVPADAGLSVSIIYCELNLLFVRAITYIFMNVCLEACGKSRIFCFHLCCPARFYIFKIHGVKCL